MTTMNETHCLDQALSALRYFRMHYPRGGQHNDGFTLSASFHHTDDADLLDLLTHLGITPVVRDEQPPAWEQYGDPVFDAIDLHGQCRWLEEVGTCQIGEDWFHVSHGGGMLRVVANVGAYDVQLSDALKAARLERRLDPYYFNPRTRTGDTASTPQSSA